MAERGWVGGARVGFAERERSGWWQLRMDRRRPRACHTRLDHVEDVVVEEAAEDQVVGPLLRVRAKGKQRRVVLLREELHRRRVLKRVHRVVPPQVHACRGGTEAVSGLRAALGQQGGCVCNAEERAHCEASSA